MKLPSTPFKIAGLLIAVVGLLAFALLSLGMAPGIFWIIVRWAYKDELGPLFGSISFVRQLRRALIVGIVMTAVTLAFSNAPSWASRFNVWFGQAASFVAQGAIGLRVPSVVALDFLRLFEVALIYTFAALVVLLAFAPIAKRGETSSAQPASQ